MMMKISKSKRQLAQLLIEAGVTEFPDSASWAVQDKCDLAAVFSSQMPKFKKGRNMHYCGSSRVKQVALSKLTANWHQTKLSSDEFDQIVAETAPDADGWIEWSGGERPVDASAMVVCTVRSGKEWRNGKAIMAGVLRWYHTGGMTDIIAYRLHKPEQAKPEFCESVTRSILEPTPAPTLDQLLQDWRNADDFAKRKQAEAGEAATMRDERWEAVQARAGEMGVTVGVRDSVSVDRQKLVITDCRYLKVKDEIEVVVPSGGNVTAGERGVIVNLSGSGFWCNFPSQKSYWYYNTQFDCGDVKFIRRP